MLHLTVNNLQLTESLHVTMLNDTFAKQTHSLKNVKCEMKTATTEGVA